MPTAPRTFRRQVADRIAERPTVEFMIEAKEEDGEVQQYHATRPTEERLFLLAALAGSEDSTGAEEAAATLELLRDALPEDEFRILRRRIGDPNDFVNIEMVQEILMWLVEEWSTFPTEPSSVSSAPPPATGTRSTGRVRGTGSTSSVTP